VVKKHYGVEHRQSPEIKATYQHIWLKKYVDANIKVITLPAGQDPDDVIRKDPEQWAQLVEQALPLMEYYFQVAAAGKDLGSAEGKSMLVRQLLPLMKEIGDGIERAHYLQKLARLVRIDERTLAEEMKHLRARRRVEGSVADDELSPALQTSPALENYCLFLLLHAAEFVDELDELVPDDFVVAENRYIFEALVDSLEAKQTFDVEGFQATLDPLLREHLHALLEEGAKGPSLPEDQLPAEIERSVWRMKDRKDRRELEELESLLLDVQERHDEEGVALRRRVDSLRRRIMEREKVRGGTNA
jgi:DNA primase